MSSFDWFFAGMCVALGGQWIGKLLTDQHRGRIIYGRKPAPPAGPPKQPLPELQAVPPALVRDWINRHGVFRTVSTGGQPERTGTNWDMVIIEAARWGQQQGWEACNATETASQPPAFTEGPVQRGHGNGGPTTKKPPIVAKPQFPPPRTIREDLWP